MLQLTQLAEKNSTQEDKRGGVDMKIGLICGHGDGDQGALSKAYGTEASLVRKLAPKIKAELSKYCTVEILNTARNWYYYLQTSNYDFTRFDYIIELHGNAGVYDQNGDGTTTGVEVFVTTAEKYTTVETDLVKKLSSFGLKNRGVKVTDFLVISCIRNQGVSCCLVENGFMDDKDDMKVVHDNMDAYCKAFAQTVASSFGLMGNKKPDPVKPTKPNNTKPKPEQIKVEKYLIGTPVCTGIIASSSGGGNVYYGDWSGVITKVIAGAKYPYLIDNGAIGWTNDAGIDNDPHIPNTKPSNTSKSKTTFKVGDWVGVKTGAKDYDGNAAGGVVRGKVYYTVDELKGNRAVLDIPGICTAFNTKDLFK